MRMIPYDEKKGRSVPARPCVPFFDGVRMDVK